MSTLKKPIQKTRLALLVAVSLMVPIAVFAQGSLEEIVVTATKRASTLQDIPISVSVTTADTIEKAQIKDLFDLQTVVPSLRVSQLQTSRNANFIIRGFGNGANNPGIEPSVGVFIDGVYRSRSAASISDLPRLERVEVLNGPQSTLFGKNASAGVVSVVTPKPSGETGGFISGTVGEFSMLNVKALYEGSIGDDIAFDIAGSYTSRDGYIKNLARGSDLNERNRYAVRGQLAWSPTDNSSLRLIADYDKLDEDCCGVANLVNGPTGAAVNFLGGQLVPNDPDALAVHFDDPSVNEISNFGVSLQADIDYDNFSVTSITSFRNNSVEDNQDIDFTSADLTNSNLNEIDIDTFTQEIRFASTGDNTIDWLVGGFYFDEKVTQNTDVLFGPAFRAFNDIGIAAAGAQLGIQLPTLAQVEGLIGLPVGSFFQNNSGSMDHATLDNRAISIFGQFDWHLSDSFTATLGFNYTDDEKDFFIESVRTELRGTLQLPAFLSFIPVTPPITVGTENPVEDSRTSDDELTYTLRLAYDINDNLNVYATYATGFKASSVNLSRDSAPTQADFARLGALGLLPPNANAGTRFANPEEAEVFELGFKANFDRGSLNVAIFDQTLENFQSNIFTGLAFVLANAEKQSVKGAELDFDLQLTDSFGFGIDVTLLDPLFDSFTQSASGDLSGLQPAGISETNISVNALYEFQLGSWDAFIRGDYQYESDVQVVDGISPDIASRELKLLNVSTGITTENGLSATLWARNLNDESFLISAFPSVAQAGSFSGYRSEPRTYGITLRKDF